MHILGLICKFFTRKIVYTDYRAT